MHSAVLIMQPRHLKRQNEDKKSRILVLSWQRMSRIEAALRAIQNFVFMMLLACGLLASYVAPSATPSPAGQTSSSGAPSTKDSIISPSPVMLPPSSSVAQSITIQGRTLAYHATAGALPVRNVEGRVIAQVVYTSFVLDRRAAAKRPITFAFGGGPGASTGSLVLALGPKRAQAGVQGDTPSTSLDIKDNPGTWLEFTDLVFIDPVGTGFSRSFDSEELTAQTFYGVEQDVHYLSAVIYDWLKTQERMQSPKYILGESYGGFRAPRIVQELDDWDGVGISGLILISPILDFNVPAPSGESRETLSPMSWAVDLPSMAASNYERQGMTLTRELMRSVEEYALGDYLTTLLKGTSDSDAFDRMVQHVAAFTGMPESRVRDLGGRLEQGVFLREAQRSARLIGSRYDINWTTQDPFPWSNDSRGEDIVLQTFTVDSGGMTDLLTRTIGWKAPGLYRPYNPTISAKWSGLDKNTESLTALRNVLALDSSLKVLIAHGYTDLSCSYLMSKIAVDQVPTALKRDRLTLQVYAGGHMFYDRPASGLAFRAAAAQLYP
jgi:carboxypeptidase C (cathepsin A)